MLTHEFLQRHQQQGKISEYPHSQLCCEQILEFLGETSRELKLSGIDGCLVKSHRGMVAVLPGDLQFIPFERMRMIVAALNPLRSRFGEEVVIKAIVDQNLRVLGGKIDGLFTDDEHILVWPILDNGLCAALLVKKATQQK